MPDPDQRLAISAADIRDAASRLAGIAARTPLLESDALSKAVGGRILVKAESLQPVGSFKLRGAYNLISRLTPAEKTRGVVAFSSGNHAQAVAAVAATYGAPAVIAMPSDAPAAKIEGTRSRGAEVVLYDRLCEDREAIGRKLATERGATLVPPFDHPHIIAGQGTVGLEIAEQLRERRLTADAVVVPCSGGGLVAGVATALAVESPRTKVFAVEPEGFDDTARSLAAGARVGNAPGATSICDALLVATPGALTFAINRQLLAGAVAVNDVAVKRAMRAAFDSFRLVVEPGGAAALAAVLEGKIDVRDRTTVVVLSGGNVDPALFADVLAGRLKNVGH
ncbi:MAG TPA: threonine/serine dehydratase [Alphaproteobacteria bacterium]|nr:threonine/serine dehydratase [Alphaproteobacteria bacterium]